MVTHEADLLLAQRCLRGDAEAREQLGARLACVPRILAARNRRLPAPVPADALSDIAGEVTVQAWNKLADYNGFAALESWLFRFCEFTLLNAARHLRRTATASLDAEPSEAPDPPADAQLDLERIHRALDRLPPDEFAVVRAKHFEEQTFEAIAARFSLPLTTAKGRYYRALDRLRLWLRPSEVEARGRS